MRIQKVYAENYRSLEEFTILLDPQYNIIAGRNNSGKTNIFRIIRILTSAGARDLFNPNKYEVEWDEDVTQWNKASKPAIKLSIKIGISRSDDPGIIEFISRMQKDRDDEINVIEISKTTPSDNVDVDEISINGKSITESYARNEILKWIRESDFVIHHDSTSYASMQGFWRGEAGVFSLTREEKVNIDKINKQYSTAMKKIARSKKEKIENLLGSIGEKYIVDLDYPKFRFDTMPFDITLSERKGEEIRLDNWGSGTRNRTLIFSSLLRASQLVSDIGNPSRVKPIVIVEEPEAFLHPSAQSNFGRVLEELSREIGIQLIVSSHSPFLLSHNNVNSNYLLERCQKRGRQLETKLTDTSGDGWLRPYSEALAG